MVQKRHTWPFYLGCAIAVVVTVAVTVFFAYTLHLRTEYKAFAREVNDVVLAIPAGDCTIERDGQVWQADEALVDYYDRFLLQENVNVVSRKGAADNSKTLTLRLKDNALSFTGLDNSFYIALRWDTPQGSRTYIVNGGSFSYMQLSAYLSSFAKKHEPIS